MLPRARLSTSRLWTRRSANASLALIASVCVCVCVSVWVAACAAADESATLPSDDPWSVAELAADARWLPILATQDLAVGVKRMAFSLDGLRADDHLPTVRVSLYLLDQRAPPPRSVQYARFIPYDAGLGLTAHNHANASVSDRSLPISRGVYVVPVQLTEPGQWGALLEIEAGEAMESVRLRFSVRERPAAPRAGERAPAVVSRTRGEVQSLATLTSDPEPEPGLYALSIDAALAQQRPLLLAFATPAFCHSRTCAPVLDAVKAVWREFATEINGIHVEVFENPQEPSRLVEARAFAAWGLPSEPWVFVIDRENVIRYAFEGALTQAELRSAVVWVLQDDR